MLQGIVIAHEARTNTLGTTPLCFGLTLRLFGSWLRGLRRRHENHLCTRLLMSHGHLDEGLWLLCPCRDLHDDHLGAVSASLHWHGHRHARHRDCWHTRGDHTTREGCRNRGRCRYRLHGCRCWVHGHVRWRGLLRLALRLRGHCVCRESLRWHCRWGGGRCIGRGHAETVQGLWPSAGARSGWPHLNWGHVCPTASLAMGRDFEVTAGKSPAIRHGAERRVDGDAA